jgi:hypothetical protein
VKTIPVNTILLHINSKITVDECYNLSVVAENSIADRRYSEELNNLVFLF